MGGGHLFHAVGNCCIMCGVPITATNVPRLDRAFRPTWDDRAKECPGGPGSNIAAITHIIAERKLAAKMHYDRPFRYPPL